ncbi:MAG: efflux RND transporter periplasmic adaptor subunit [Planctomycetota bacterium]|jgi:RND family efflux transporter MFP subunit
MADEPKKPKRLGIIIGSILILGSVYAVFFIDWGKGKQDEPMPVRPLKIIHIGEMSTPDMREYPGKVTAKDTVIMAFQVEGQVVEFPMLKGQEVTKGELLAKLDDRDYQNRYDSAKATFDQADVQLKRIQKAAETGAVSETDLTNAQATFESTKARMNIARKALADTLLKAPYDAVISNTYVENFENVRAKQSIIGVQDIRTIQVDVAVPQERVLKGKEMRGRFRFSAVFDSLPDVEFNVVLAEYTTEADPMTQTYTVTFSMPAQEEYNIFPGMTATVRQYPIEGAFEETGRFLVPIDAVPIDGQGQYYVWKVQDTDGTLSVHRQNVTVGKTVGGESGDVEIIEGLSEADRIAAQGVHLLQEGQEVREYKLKAQED